MPRTPDAADRLQGTLDMLILKTLSSGPPQHGWGISLHLRQTSREVFQVHQGSLYPALHRLEEQGWITAEWGTTENNRRARFYTLTTAGRRHLRAEAASWTRYAAAVSRILQTATQGA